MSNGIQTQPGGPGATFTTADHPHAELLDRVLAQPRHSLAEVKEMAKTVTQSGLYGMTQAQCETLMLVCQAEGVHPIEAIRRYHIIEGRPAMRADYMQAVYQAHGGRLNWLKSTPEECEAEFWHPLFHPEPTRFAVSMKELVDSGVARGQSGVKANYRRHPRQMLRARVLTEGIRAIDPGVIVGMYSDEEVADMEPKPTETTAHASLRENLRTKRVEREARAGNGQRAEHQAVAETVAELKAANGSSQPAEAPEAAPEAPKSDFRKWVDEQLAEVNKELVKPISPYQVANHLLKVGIDEAFIDSAHITGPDGKRDKQAAAAVLGALWDEDGPWVLDVVGRYLAQKVAEAHQAAGGAEVLATPQPVQQALPV